MLAAMVGLQLWLTQGMTILGVSSLSANDPLAHALRDADTLLRRFGLQETVEVRIEPPSDWTQLILKEGGTVVRVPDSLAAVAAVYALLEEKHGLAFVHPKHTVRATHVPSWQVLAIRPRFRYRGFHLHTQHPIELTEALHDPAFPEGEHLVREYIDWLVRNRQNYFEFCLLRTVRLSEWVPYFTQLVSYARARGVEVGLDLSLRMQQQYAFQLMPRWRAKGRALRMHLTQLRETGVSRLNVDLNAAEFVGKAWGPWIDSLLMYAQALGLKVMSRQHVVPPDAYAVGDFRPSDLPPELTICVHSVMCYGLKDTLAPVYHCKDFSHLYQTILTEHKRRRVWYYPESAYWVTFDNSVPVWLLSYLRSRLEDIALVEGLVEGHLTFSSGWDVGYWLFDWSIARWSWRYAYDGREAKPLPSDGLIRLFGGDTLYWERLVRFQDSVLVGRNVLSYITPTTPIDEISWTHLPPFQPRLPVPPWRIYRQPKRYRSFLQPHLEGMAQALASWLPWEERRLADPHLQALHDELKTAWELTKLRVGFRYYWLRALLSQRGSKVEARLIDSLEWYVDRAERLVQRLPVRYPHTIERRLCRSGARGCKHPHPSYRFGYLYPAVSLHFWRREIGQVRDGRWGVLYRNLWNIPRITGLW